MSRNVGGGRRLGSKNAVHVRLDAVRHREPTVNAEELRRLSEAATPGPWRHFHSHEITAVLSRRKAPVVGWPGFDDSAVPRAQHDANAAFIVALVNLYRSNQLQVIERDRLAEALRGQDGVLQGWDWDDQSPPGWRHLQLADAIIQALDSTTGDAG